jgi:DNA-binding winged helix-turn-helix (wHTH) protein
LHLDLFITANLPKLERKLFRNSDITVIKYLSYLISSPSDLLFKDTIILNSWKEETKVDRAVVEAILALVLAP